MTNGRFRDSQVSDSFPAMNLKSRRSPPDPNLTVALLHTGQSVKSRIRKLEVYKAVTGDRAVQEDVMGEFVISRWLGVFGWSATVSMAVVVLGMFATWLT